MLIYFIKIITSLIKLSFLGLDRSWSGHPEQLAFAAAERIKTMSEEK